MNDWSGSMVQLERHLKKATEDLTLINAGLATHVRGGLCAKVEEHLCQAQRELMNVWAWLKLQQ